jgi:c-di-GMP-binding flagellar brake protein YcgR
MVWLKRPSISRERDNQRQAYRQSIELPIAFTVRGLPAPVYGTLINISETGCRLRSLILLARNRQVEFTLRRAGAAHLNFRGRVLSRSTPQTGAGYEYGLAFEDLTPASRDAIAREIAELQRRAAAARAQAREAHKKALARGDDQRRSAVRTLFSFPVRYRPADRSASSGEANDISSGGLRLQCSERLRVGGEIELRFTLPSDVLKAYPPPTERIEITPFGERRMKLPDNRRPFEEMVVRGRVLSRVESQPGREIYGVAFTDIDGYQREEIARFTHAVQLSRIRNAG